MWSDMSEFKKRLALTGSLAVVIALTLGFAILYLPANMLGSSPLKVLENRTVLSGGACAQTFSNGLTIDNYSQSKSIVFTMEPNETAQVCVSYIAGDDPDPYPVTYSVSNFGIIDIHYNCNGTSCSGVGVPGNFTMSANPASFSLYPSNNVSQIIIVYTIHAFQNSDGLYSLQYLNQCPKDIPFAVKYAPPEISSSNFTGFFTPNFCAGSRAQYDGLSSGVIVGLTNIQYSYINVNFSQP
jgi:hypothetical protein